MGDRRTLRLAPAQSWQNSAPLRSFECTSRLCVTIPIFRAVLEVRLRPRASGDGSAGNSKTRCQIRVFLHKSLGFGGFIPTFVTPATDKETKFAQIEEREEVKGGRGERQEDLWVNERLILIKPPLTLRALKCKPML